MAYISWAISLAYMSCGISLCGMNLMRSMPQAYLSLAYISCAISLSTDLALSLHETYLSLSLHAMHVMRYLYTCVSSIHTHVSSIDTHVSSIDTSLCLCTAGLMP